MEPARKILGLAPRELAFLGIVSLLTLWGAFERLYYPSFWDETKVYFSQLFALLDSPSHYFAGPITERDRPMGLHLFYLPFLYAFGESLFLIRILSVIYFLVGVVLLFRVLAQESFFVAMLGISLLLITPIVQVYVPHYVGDPQLMTLFALYTYLLVYQRKRNSLVALVGVLAGLVREPAIALVPATLGFIYLQDGKLRWRDLPVILAPFAGLAVHMLRNYAHSGNFFHHVTVQEGHFDILASGELRYRNFVGVFLATYRLLPLSLFSLGALIVLRPKRKPKPLDVFALFLVGSYLFTFTGLLVVLPRYFLPCVPFAIYLLLRACTGLLTNRRRRLIFSLFALGAPLVIGNPNLRGKNIFYHFTGYQDTFDYPRMLELHTQVMAQIKSDIPTDSQIVTAWPFMEMLRSSRIGYGVLVPYDVRWHTNKAPDGIIWTNFPEQIPWSEVERYRQMAPYSLTEYSFKDYQIRVLLKQVPDKASP